MLIFEEKRKPEYPEKILLKQSREPTINSTHVWHQVWWEASAVTTTPILLPSLRTVCSNHFEHFSCQGMPVCGQWRKLQECVVIRWSGCDHCTLRSSRDYSMYLKREEESTVRRFKLKKWRKQVYKHKLHLLAWPCLFLLFNASPRLCLLKPTNPFPG